MDFFVTCAFIITIILHPHLNNKSSKLCGDLNKSISTSSQSVMSTAVHVKDCEVVLEDISSSRDAVKRKMLNTSQENTHTTSSHLIKEERREITNSVKSEAKSKNLSYATIWLDIANAYGSIPHKLIIFALHRYGVSPKWIHLIETYYSEIFSKSFSQEAPSSWHRHQREIFASCTLSIILFLAGMNIILEYYSVATTPKFHLYNILLPPMRAFMDDLNIMLSTICGAKTLLSRCTVALNWAGLTFRVDKSRSIVIIKGTSMNTTPFSVSSPRELSENIFYSFHSFQTS